jgi:hypothetical protein
MNSFTKVLCVQCKVYYGSEDRMGMCSVCFKDQKPKVNSQIPLENKKEELSNQVQDQSSIKISEPPKLDEDIKMEESPIQTRPVQTNIHACWICNKKVGYLGFKCKCDYIFCGSHRHFSDHNCDFDYKNYDREKLVKKSGFGDSVDNKMLK